jgi:hypothetical protein
MNDKEDIKMGVNPEFMIDMGDLEIDIQGLEKCISGLIRRYKQKDRSRESSLVITKLEEALMWSRSIDGEVR